MMLLGYLGKPSATVTYSITNADLTEHTAETGTGVTALKTGTLNTLYGVVVADPPIGGVIHWYEGGAYITSETITQPDAAVAGDAMTLTAAYDHAKDDVLTPIVEAKAGVDAVKADYARRTGDYNTIAPLNAAATQAAAQAAIVAEPATLAADQPLYAPTTLRDLEPLAKPGDAMTLTAAYDAAKAAASQASVNAIPTTPLLADDYIAPPTDYAKTGEAASAVASLGYVAPDNASAEAAAASAASADGKLTAERLAKLDGAAQEATLEAVKLRTDTLDAATGTLTLSFRLLLDSDGDGIADVPAVGVGGVTCHLLAHGTHTRIRESATTDSQGYVYWHGLAAGTYDVDPDAAGYEGVTVAVTIPEV